MAMTMTTTTLQKPFLKWVGGKTQIINKIIDKFPKEINNYYEIFLGGGSVLLALLSLEKAGQIIITNKIYAFDLNKSLINVYINIQSNKDELFEYITLYINEYDSIEFNSINRKPTTIDEAKTSKESYYYWIRNKFNNMNKDTIEYSALFMFLNKTCFRGIYREGPNGFNVPYGHYKKTPTIITKQELNNISELIQKVEFICSDFTESMMNIDKGDYVYLDPPYAPETKTSFVKYTSNGFDLECHKRLFEEINKIKNNNIKFTMSNSKVNLVIEHFNDSIIEDVIARRAINSKNPESNTTEVIIYN
jgi:DNA adenine methylase